MYIPCEASSWTFLHQNRKLSSRISLQNQLFCLCRLPAVIYAISNVSTFSRITKYARYWLPIILINGEMHEVCKIVLWYILHTRCIHICILNSKRQNKNKTNKQKEKEKTFHRRDSNQESPAHIAVPRPLGYGAMCSNMLQLIYVCLLHYHFLEHSKEVFRVLNK